MLVILSPSKTQDFQTPSKAPFTTQPLFKQEIHSLLTLLKQMSPDEIAKLMSISEKLSHLNYERFQNLKDIFLEANSKPAIEAFQGDVYRDIATANYTPEDFQFAQDHLRTISGLYGLLRPLDLMQPYRLEMKTKLKNSKGKDLYQFWGTKITDELNKANQPIINLASKEYSKAAKLKEINQPVIDITFREKKGNDYKIVAIYSKIARGTMANFIVKNRITKPTDLHKFNLDSYAYSSDYSTDQEYVYLRG